MKKFKLFHIFCLFVIASCSSTTKKISNNTIDQIALNSDKSAINAVLGEPQSILSSEYKNKKIDHLIYYSDKNKKQQKFSISIDANTQTVISKTYIPSLDSEEENLDYWIKNKFSANAFINVPLKRCQRHYEPSEIFYMNIENGIIINFNKRMNIVESVTWTSSSQIKAQMDDIKNCLR